MQTRPTVELLNDADETIQKAAYAAQEQIPALLRARDGLIGEVTKLDHRIATYKALVKLCKIEHVPKAPPLITKEKIEELWPDDPVKSRSNPFAE